MHNVCQSWTAFNTADSRGCDKLITPMDVIPLFTEKAQSLAMMFHTMSVVKAVVEHLNPGWIPVLVADAQLYALLRKIQFTMVDAHGEEKFFTTMDGLHIELAALRMADKWLQGSGWTSVLVDAGVATQGKADSVLKASHIKRSRYALEDLIHIEDKHLDKAHAFKAGEFVARKTMRPSSVIALDHAHEQINAALKSGGGIIGLTEKPDTLRRCEKDIVDPLKCNRFPTFKMKAVQEQGKNAHKTLMLRYDCALFSQLYIACLTRSGNLEDYFRHENQPYPPSLSVSGEPTATKIFKLHKCGAFQNVGSVHFEPKVDTKELDGAAIVHVLTKGATRTCNEYIEHVLILYIASQDTHVVRLDVLSNTDRIDLQDLTPCYHEEADTRMLLHIVDAAIAGHKQIMAKAVDTDIIVLAVVFFQCIEVEQLWVAIGPGKYLKYQPVHEITNTLGIRKASALLCFHAFTGCDNVAYFGGRGMKTAWKV
ncbi:hypothetical protein PR048_031111 [Dryococelus australis]|uniref:Uncharacterized protein n=1 Tax=Dryococelus australis TaxID=614101 RepID=A0ABQ9G4D4_9NEOP|nr:hypothetical protein PR048_031111 [Dryococelus australis]